MPYFMFCKRTTLMNNLWAWLTQSSSKSSAVETN